MALYILPNIMASIIVVFSTGLGVIILAEAALAFIVPQFVPQEGPASPPPARSHLPCSASISRAMRFVTCWTRVFAAVNVPGEPSPG
jgi:hypothetical protein